MYASQLKRAVEERQVTINQLYNDISRFEDTYNEVSDADYLESHGFTQANETNTQHRTRDPLYEEPTVAEVPSNWFNDFGNFLSKMFG